MFWKKISLDGYIPFSHVGNKHVEIEFDSPATCIIGANGCGKSSLLRIMDVLTPPTRPDFAKDGKIEMTIEHDGHLFVLTSDFKNATSPHSFKRDGVELNLSGTSDTQKDLVIEHLGITSLINELMAVNIHICSMQKAQRKQLFSSAYPSDLSFVLEYHKKVCTQIRTFSNQIKLLQGREGSLVASKMQDNELNRIKEWSVAANGLVTRIDKINLLLNNEIEQLRSHEALQKHPDQGVNMDILNNASDRVNQIHTSIVSKLLHPSDSVVYGEDLSVHMLNMRESKVRQEAGFLKDRANDIRGNLCSIKDELDKFTRLKNTPSSDKRDEIVGELERSKKEMEELRSKPEWTDAPAIPRDKLELVENALPLINDIIATLHPYAGKLIGQENISKLRSESDSIRFALTGLNTERMSLTAQIQQHISRKAILAKNNYPPDCSRVCGLRASLEATLSDIDLRIKDIESRLEAIAKEEKAYVDRLEECQNTLQTVSPVIPIMKRLYDKLTDIYVVNLALDGEGFVDCLNAHCFDIINRIKHGLDSSKLYHRYVELKQRVDSITNTLTMMDSNDAVAMSMDVIEGIIKDKESSLEHGIHDLEQLEVRIRDLVTKADKITGMQQDVASLDKLIVEINDAINSLIVSNRIEFDTQMIREHESIRDVVSRKLREVEYTLQEQKRISDVLETEIRPTMQELREQRRLWEIVESGLSPTKGLPCIYLIRFMNRIFARANEIISRIWFCDMELAYIDEKENLDFSISLILNKSSTVKDISLCSNGQKAVIDFAVTLAIAIERGFNKWLPFKCDEIDAALTPERRTKLTQYIADSLDDGTIKQLMLVNHFSLQTGLLNVDVVSLSDDDIVLPEVYNKHVIIN